MVRIRAGQDTNKGRLARRSSFDQDLGDGPHEELDDLKDHLLPIKSVLAYIVFMIFYLMSTFNGLSNPDIFWFGDHVSEVTSLPNLYHSNLLVYAD